MLPVEWSKEDKLFIVELNSREDLPIVPRQRSANAAEGNSEEAAPVAEAAQAA